MIAPKTREGQQQPEQKKVNNSNRIFLRLPSSYIPFFQAMAQDYYQRGKIKTPTIGLLAKTSLITAGNAWNRMMHQLMTRDFERRRQLEQDRGNNNKELSAKTRPHRYFRRFGATIGCQ